MPKVSDKSAARKEIVIYVGGKPRVRVPGSKAKGADKVAAAPVPTPLPAASAESKLAPYERALCEAQRTGEAAEVGDLFGPASVCAMSSKQVSIEVLRARVAAARVRATQKNDTGPPPR
ncbi:hypothetical protein C6P46_001650 [Rhodotorula mucilaginosa]|uniref:Uncharacterized protein n=1 Tax=Rhodotorula mucilaginosa TaxID=5537 RepID=A0A9P7B277_RHOMI|nr:hypothetical protein C6P46_001650 [Rhodotorula mucilaginosa]